MILPVRDGFAVFLLVQGHARPPFLFSQRIPQGRNGRHGQFVIDVLGFDADNPPRCLDRQVSLVALGGIFLIDLIARVQNQIQVVCDGQVVFVNGVSRKIPLQDGQFLVVAGRVTRSQQMFVVGGNFQNVDPGVGKIVLNEKVFAKGSVAVL